MPNIEDDIRKAGKRLKALRKTASAGGAGVSPGLAWHICLDACLGVGLTDSVSSAVPTAPCPPEEGL